MNDTVLAVTGRDTMVQHDAVRTWLRARAPVDESPIGPSVMLLSYSAALFASLDDQHVADMADQVAIEIPQNEVLHKEEYIEAWHLLLHTIRGVVPAIADTHDMSLPTPYELSPDTTRPRELRRYCRMAHEAIVQTLRSRRDTDLYLWSLPSSFDQFSAAASALPHAMETACWKTGNAAALIINQTGNQAAVAVAQAVRETVDRPYEL